MPSKSACPSAAYALAATDACSSRLPSSASPWLPSFADRRSSKKPAASAASAARCDPSTSRSAPFCRAVRSCKLAPAHAASHPPLPPLQPL
eukprot:6190150-Pleurochrysis_carterae.AAC.3